MTIGQRIYNLRTENGLTQEQLSEKLEVSRQSISKWELEESICFMQVDFSCRIVIKGLHPLHSFIKYGIAKK